MLDWLKSTWGALVVALLAFAAFMATQSARRHKQTAEKWAGKAVADKDADVEAGTVNAKAALTQAKLHDIRAKEALNKGRNKIDAIGNRDENMADIVDGWRKSGRMRD